MAALLPHQGCHGYPAEAEQTARQIVQLREQLRDAAQAGGVSVNALKLMDHLFKQPIINEKAASEALRRIDLVLPTG